jgi:transaldolase/glucose-6-phosphate isomerase
MTLGVNPFDQPDVQDAKVRTRNNIAIYQEKGAFDEGSPIWEGQGVRIFGDLPKGIKDLKDALDTFLASGRIGDYVALNAYVPRNTRNETLLKHLRVAIRAKTRLATTVGFGPRFLHSTGQLHKGGADNGIFLQITADPIKDVAIPGQGLSFGVLERGQSLGDLEALRARGRRVMRLHLAEPDLLNFVLDALND